MANYGLIDTVEFSDVIRTICSDIQTLHQGPLQIYVKSPDCLKRVSS